MSRVFSEEQRDWVLLRLQLSSWKTSLSFNWRGIVLHSMLDSWMYNADRLLSTHGWCTCWSEDSWTTFERTHAQTFKTLWYLSVWALDLHTSMVHLLICLQLLVRSTSKVVGYHLHKRNKNVIFNYVSDIRLTRAQITWMLKYLGNRQGYGRITQLHQRAR
jgi:hypothetical protein